MSVNADDNDQLQNYEVDSSSVNTPLNPLSPKRSGQARGDGVAEGNARGVSAEARNNDLILEILDDIEANLRKIHEHGKRAESIVKSMLLHSRCKSGKPVPTNLNAILDEYTKLAYHAMRAADSSFNVEIETEFDHRNPLVSVIPQD